MGNVTSDVTVDGLNAQGYLQARIHTRILKLYARGDLQNEELDRRLAEQKKGAPPCLCTSTDVL